MLNLPCYGKYIRNATKSKAFPQQAVEACKGCEMLRIPHCLDNRLTDGCKVVSFMHQSRSTPQKLYFCASGTDFCYELSEPQSYNAAGRIR
jgi:hypothetical protein